jgi:hypothetical protein
MGAHYLPTHVHCIKLEVEEGNDDMYLKFDRFPDTNNCLVGCLVVFQ